MTFELDVVAAGDVDDAIADLCAVRLERLDQRVLITCARLKRAQVVATLARAGVAASPVSAIAALHRPAIVDHLRPFAIAGVHDVVEVRAVPLGEAVALVRAATRDLLGRRRRERRERLAALLAERDRLLLWRRIAYAPASALRGGRIPGARPVVFDRRGVERARERWTTTTAGALAAWLRS